jgi:hypothetical protein
LKARLKHPALLFGALLLLAAAAVISGCTNSSSTAQTTVYDTAQNFDFYSLFIGINQYPTSVNSLTFCVNDAVVLRNSLQYSDRWNGKAAKLSLLDDDASKPNIRDFIQIYKEKANSSTKFVLCYSGHGTNDGSQAYLVVWKDTSNPTDYDLISASELQSWLTGAPSIGIIYLDSCYAGGFIGKNKAAESSTPRVFTGTPGYDDAYAGGFKFPAETKGLEQIPRLVAVTACTGAEVSWETPNLQQGVFSYFLADGLGRGAAMGPADFTQTGEISVEETFAYLSPLVVAYPLQDPQILVQNPQIQDNYVGDLIVK